MLAINACLLLAEIITHTVMSIAWLFLLWLVTSFPFSFSCFTVHPVISLHIFLFCVSIFRDQEKREVHVTTHEQVRDILCACVCAYERGRVCMCVRMTLQACNASLNVLINI